MSGRETFFRSRWVDAAGRGRGARPGRSSRPASAPAASPAGSRAAARPTSACSSATPTRSRSALLLTRNAAAAAPVRVCRERCDARRDPRRGRQLRQRQRRHRRAGLRATRSRCATRPPRRSASSPRGVAVAETGTIGVPLPIDAVLGGIARGRRRASRRAAASDFARGDHDHRPLARSAARVRAGGVTVSAQAKGAGMIEPGFATMLCFVQTDAVVDDPDAALRARRRRLLRADHRRRPDEHQRHRAAAGDRRGRRAAARGPARRGAAAARARDRRRRRGRDPGRPGRGRRAPPTPTRPSGSRARSPTRRWSRRRSSAATPTGAGSPRPPAWRSPARSSRSSGPTGSTPPSSAPTAPRPRSRCASAAATQRAHVYFSRPELRVRPDQRGVHDMSEPTAERQRRDPARGAALHPGVPRPHGRDQVRRRGDARRGAARGLRHRRRPAQVRRPQPGDRPRRRPRDHPATWSGSGWRSASSRACASPTPETVEVAKMVLLGKVNSDIVQRLNRHGQPAVGLSRRGRLAVRGPAGRRTPSRSASSARSSGSTSTSSTTSPRTTSR